MMTPKKLRDAAWALDKLTELTLCLLEPVRDMDPMNAETLEVTVRVTKGDRPMTSDEARRILEWVDGDDMQVDLRAFADELEQNNAQKAGEERE